MTNQKVSVERYLQQVQDGVHYKGHVKIADTKLDYELVFAVPILELDKSEPPQGVDEIRRLFQITVKRDGANVELTNDEYGLFFSMIATLAIEFYNNRQTRDTNEGLLGMLMRGESDLSYIASASIGVTSQASYDLSPELSTILSAPKFGISLGA